MESSRVEGFDTAWLSAIVVPTGPVAQSGNVAHVSIGERLLDKH